MIISTNNKVRINNFTTNAVVTSGSAANVRDVDFSKNMVTSSTDFRIDMGAATVRYVGVHGLSLPIGTVVEVRDGATVKDTYTTTRDSRSLVFDLGAAQAFTNLRVNFNGAGQKIISYIAAGDAIVISWGVNAGKSLSYFANNQRNRSVVNQRGLPTSFLTERISPKLSLVINNELKVFTQGDLQDIFTHYNLDGVISIRDYEEENFPDEACAAFELSSDRVMAHNQTTKLANIRLNFKVS